MYVNVSVDGRPAAVIHLGVHAKAVWVEHTARAPAADYRSPPEPLLSPDALAEALEGIGDSMDLPVTWARTVPVHLGRPPLTSSPPLDFLADCLRAAVLNAR